MISEDNQLEIGPKRKPILLNLKPEYIGSGTPFLLDKKDWRSGNFNGLNTIPFIQGNAEKLPFANNSVSAVVEKDVFCAEGQVHDNPGGDIIREKVGDVHTIASEIYRITKPGGKAIIIETLSPTKQLMDAIYKFFIKSGFTLLIQMHNEEIRGLFNSEPKAKMTLDTEDATAFIFQKNK